MNKFLEECERKFNGNVTSLNNVIMMNFDYKDYIKENHFKYHKQLVYKSPTNKFEIFIITWCPFQESPIHDHSKNGCLLRVLEGELTEDLYNKDIKFVLKSKFKKDDVSYLDNDIGYHRIINLGRRSITLHIYSPCNYNSITY